MGRDAPTAGDGTDRRTFLQSAAAATAGGGLASMLAERTVARPVEPREADRPGVFAVDGGDADDTFPQSVMSGGPTASGVILWTRIAPDAARAGVPLGLEVATDGDFTDVVYRGTVDADAIGPDHDHTVKVDLDGKLDSNTAYRYRFVYDGVATRPGRCRTLPTTEDDFEDLSLGLLACQDYQNGYYGAYHHVAREDVEFLLHMGDFVYESADGRYVPEDESVREDRDFDLPSGNPLAETLADFRFLYRTYKSDPLLQEALERHTLVAGWDDHEIGNNRYWDDDADAPVLPDRREGDEPDFALELTADGIQAWVEHVPARVEYDPAAEDLHEQLQLWRTVEFGDLVELVVTDERLFRDGPPCEDDTVECTEEGDEDRTMLGERQKEWWKGTVGESSARWTAWLNEVLTVPLTFGQDWYQVELLHDSWDGYQAERHELMDHVAEASVRNFVTLTGDLHASAAAYAKAGYGEVSDVGERVGVELVTPALTSINAASQLDLPTSLDSETVNDIARLQNDHLAYVDWYRQGYAVVTFTPEECRYTVYAVDKEADSPPFERTKLATFRVPDRDIDLQEEYNHFEENFGSDLL